MISTIVDISKGKKLNVKRKRNWEFSSVASGSIGHIYFDDSTDIVNPYLMGVEHSKIKDCWMNFKLVSPNPRKIFYRRKVKGTWRDTWIPNEKSTIRYVNNKVSWANCYNDTDITYDNFNGKVKETIILKSPKAPLTFKFSVKKSKGLKFKKDLDGNIDVFKNGEKVFFIERPVAVDRRGRKFYYNFTTKKSGKYTIFSMEPVDIDAIRSASYPLVIDPTTTIVISSDAYISTKDGDCKCILTTPKGSIVAVYADGNDLYIAESTDSCQNWETWDTGLNMRTPEGYSQYSVDVDSNGVIHIVYPTTGAPYLMHASSVDGFDASTTIDGDRNGYAGALAIDSNDKLHLAYFTATGLYYGYSTNGGGTWSNTEIANGTLRWHPSIAIDSTNTVCIAWEFSNTGRNVFRALSSASWAIETITTEVLSTHWQEHPTVAFTTNDSDYVFWSGKIDAAEFRIRYIEETGTDTVYNFTDGSKECKMPSVGLDPSGGKLFVSWSEYNQAPNIYYLRQAFEAGGSLSTPTYTGYFSDEHLQPCGTRWAGTTNDPILFMQHDTVSVYTTDPFNAPWNLADTIVTDGDTIAILDTLAPRESVAIDIASTPVSTDISATLSVTWNEANPNTNIFGFKINSESWTTTAGDVNTSTPSDAVSFDLVNGNDLFSIRCVHTDDYGGTLTSQVNDLAVEPTAPDAPTLSGATYNSLDVVANNNATDSAAIAPDVFDHAIHVQGGATDGWLQGDGSVSASEVWNTVGEWGTKTITGLAVSTSYTVYSKVRNPNATSEISANGTSVQEATISIPPVVSGVAVTVPIDGTKVYTIAYDTEDDDDSFLSVAFSYYDGSDYVAISSVQGDIGSIAVTSTLTTKEATWSAGTDANNVSIQTAHVKVAVSDGDSSVTDTSANFILDTKIPDFPDPTVLVISGIADTLFTVTWDNTVVDTNFDTYELYLSSTSLAEAKSKGGIKWDDDDDANMGADTTTSTSVTGLTANTTYYLSLFAIDVRGNYSTDVVTTTDATEYKRTISGYVYDDKGAVVPSANVRMYNKTSGALISSTTSSSTGYYTFTFYSSLTYYIVTYKEGWGSDINDNLSGTISGDDVTEQYNFELNGVYTRRASDEADIWMGRGNTIIELTKAVALEKIKPTIAHDAIGLDVAYEKITKTVDVGRISKTVDV